MLRSLSSSFILASLLAGALIAGDDPFVGKWKLNQDKSKIIGEQRKIEDLGANKYKISFGTTSDTLVANGTDQPVHFGRTESITKESSKTWKITYKQNEKVLRTATWTLSDDDKVMNIKGQVNKPDGGTSDFQLIMKRVGSGSGFGGTWESTKLQLNSPDEQEIKPYGAHGLTFYSPGFQETLSMNFDGKEYPDQGPNVAPGATSSGKRIDEHTLEMTDKIKGDVRGHSKFEVSPDGQTLTITTHETGQANPLTIVYDKTSSGY